MLTWLYLARRSDLHGAPVLIWPCQGNGNEKGWSVERPNGYKSKVMWNWKYIITVARPTERSAMKVSSVSPLKHNCETMSVPWTVWKWENMIYINQNRLYSDFMSKPAVASHYTPTCLLWHSYSFNTLSYRSNLIDLFPERVKECHGYS